MPKFKVKQQRRETLVKANANNLIRLQSENTQFIPFHTFNLKVSNIKIEKICVIRHLFTIFMLQIDFIREKKLIRALRICTDRRVKFKFECGIFLFISLAFI